MDPSFVGALQRAKARLDTLDWYPEPVRTSASASSSRRGSSGSRASAATTATRSGGRSCCGTRTRRTTCHARALPRLAGAAPRAAHVLEARDHAVPLESVRDRSAPSGGGDALVAPAGERSPGSPRPLPWTADGDRSLRAPRSRDDRRDGNRRSSHAAAFGCSVLACAERVRRARVERRERHSSPGSRTSSPSTPNPFSAVVKWHVPDAARVVLEVGVDDRYGIWSPTTVTRGDVDRSHDARRSRAGARQYRFRVVARWRNGMTAEARGSFRTDPWPGSTAASSRRPSTGGATRGTAAAPTAADRPSSSRPHCHPA